VIEAFTQWTQTTVECRFVKQEFTANLSEILDFDYNLRILQYTSQIYRNDEANVILFNISFRTCNLALNARYKFKTYP